MTQDVYSTLPCIVFTMTHYVLSLTLTEWLHFNNYLLLTSSFLLNILVMLLEFQVSKDTSWHECNHICGRVACFTNDSSSNKGFESNRCDVLWGCLCMPDFNVRLVILYQTKPIYLI